MPMTLAKVADFVESLDNVTVGAKWNHKTWMVGEKGFLWERPLSKADLGRLGDRPPPEGDIVAFIVENLDAKDALLAMELPGFFTIQHFNGYPGVLIELRKAKAADVRIAISTAHAVALVAKQPRKRKKKR